MTATFTADLFSTVDGFGAPQPGTWGGYWDQPSAELDAHRLGLYREPQRMVFGANTYRLFAQFAQLVGSSAEADKAADSWVTAMFRLPATVVSTSLHEPLDWADATVVRSDAVEAVAQLKRESDVPLRSHGSVSMNRALLSAGLVDFLQLTIFPVITGQTGDDPLFAGVADFNLELLEARTFDSGIREVVYRPTLHK